MATQPVLGYWDIRGLAQPLRLMLKYADVQFKDKHYITGPAPKYDKSTWLNEKTTLGLDFPNLPYYIDGDAKLTQSAAIARHIARKHGLDGKNEAEKDRMELALEELTDFRHNWVEFCYRGSKDKEQLYLDGAMKKLPEFDKFLGTNDWFAGKNANYACGFFHYEILDQHRIFRPDIFNKLNNLQNFLNRFEQLPHIKQYLQSKEFVKPLNNRVAYFGA